MTNTYITHRELRTLLGKFSDAPDDEARGVSYVNSETLNDLIASVRVLLDQTEHATRFPLVEHLTDCVLNWYGFAEAWNYTLRPYAALVAIELHHRHSFPDSLTAEDIEEADRATGGRLREMWDALNTPATSTKPAKEA